MFVCEGCWDTPCSCGLKERQREEDRRVIENYRRHPESAPTAADYETTFEVDPSMLIDRSPPPVGAVFVAPGERELTPKP